MGWRLMDSKRYCGLCKVLVENIYDCEVCGKVLCRYHVSPNVKTQKNMCRSCDDKEGDYKPDGRECPNCNRVDTYKVKDKVFFCDSCKHEWSVE